MLTVCAESPWKKCLHSYLLSPMLIQLLLTLWTLKPDISGFVHSLHCNHQMAAQNERMPVPVGDGCSQYIYRHFAVIFTKFDRGKVFFRLFEWAKNLAMYRRRFRIPGIDDYQRLLDLLGYNSGSRLVPFRKQTAGLSVSD